MKAKWIVVIVDPYYPSVYHFDNEDEAKEAYETHAGSDFVTHLAEVKEQTISPDGMDLYEKNNRNIKALDVQW